MKHVSRSSFFLLITVCFPCCYHEWYSLLPLANFTRFYILARSIDSQLPSLPTRCDSLLCPNSRSKGLLRIHEPKSHVPSPGFAHPSSRGVGLADLFSALDLPICRVDRRPLQGAKTFAHVYIVEVEDNIQRFGSVNGSPIIPISATVVEDLELRGGDTTGLQSNKPLVPTEGGEAWALRLREAADRVTGAGGDVEVLGCWS